MNHTIVTIHGHSYTIPDAWLMGRCLIFERWGGMAHLEALNAAIDCWVQQERFGKENL